MHSVRGIARFFLLSILAAAAIAIAAKLFASSPQDLAKSRAILNYQGAAALAFLFLACLEAQPDVPQRNSSDARTLMLPLVMAVLVLVCYLRSLGIPFLHDSYTHVFITAKGSWSALVKSLFTPPQRGDFFFRPLGYATFLIDSHWAGVSPFRWHLWNISIHAINSVLTFLFARRLAFSPWQAGIAAGLFAVHGSRPETVAWVAARFDLLACLFSLCCLLAVQSYVQRSSAVSAGAALLFASCAILSKESAYSLPLAILALTLFYDRKERKAVYRLAALSGALVCVLLLYRFWLLGGPGGYRTPSGTFSVLHFSLVHTLEALLFREWSLLFFPVNWSADAGIMLKCAAVANVLLLCGGQGRASRRRLFASLMLVLALSLPVQHLLLISADLNGSRVLYLPVLGLGLLMGSFCDTSHGAWAGRLLMIGIVGIQAFYLEHNLGIWKNIAVLSRQNCEAFGRKVRDEPGNVFVSNLPRIRNGVFFLSNGFPQCVAANSDVSAAGIHVMDSVSSPASGDGCVYRWDQDTNTFKRVNH